MVELAFRILNVFSIPGQRFSGNPLCVFEDARGVSSDDMQALARQLNLSETTFLLPADAPSATARVRIFTPTFEMPFAGHPTLGTAYVVRERAGGGDRVVLEMKAGLVEVTAVGDRFTLRTARSPEVRSPSASRADLAAMLGLDETAISGPPLWVDTGAEQLVVPLSSAFEVARARPDPALLARHGFSERRGASMAYTWARVSDDEIVARFFFLSHGSVVEDPATGSACANLGGYLLQESPGRPHRAVVRQGEQIGRPSVLRLEVDREGGIFVGGDVTPVARGTFSA
jgi:trans-2,3-dihydro-3-hydroxyanthranilate isomerase